MLFWLVFEFLFFGIKIFATVNLPKINNATISKEKTVKNKFELLTTIYPKNIIKIINIRYSGENATFCLRVQTEPKTINVSINNKYIA